MRRFFIDESVKPASLYVIDGDSFVAEARELERSDNMAEFSYRREASQNLEELEEVPEAPVKRGRAKTIDSSKYHGKTEKSEARRKSWNTDPGSIGEKKSGATTEKIKALVEAGKTDDEIAKEIGIGKPAVGYHKKKLGLVKPRISGRMKKKEPAPIISKNEEVSDENTGETFYRINDPDDIARIWLAVDDGIHTAGAIAARLGFRPRAVQDVLMRPRP